MTIKTAVAWSTNTPTNLFEIEKELIRQVRIGHTDGTFELDENLNVVRTWGTIEAAESWVDFLNSLDPKPALAVVQD
jgi:hypothetical protein